MLRQWHVDKVCPLLKKLDNAKVSETQNYVTQSNFLDF